MNVGNGKLNTSDKILLVAIDLMAEKGFKTVTTKEIATAAGISEMTLYRHFGSKKNLLEQGIDRFHYTWEMQKLFKEKLVWDLQTDLLLISKTYHEVMSRNGKMFLITLKERHNLPGIQKKMKNYPQQLKEMLTDYFTRMQVRGKMIPTNPETQAMSFIWMNYGAFMTNLIADEPFTDVSMEEFMTTSVALFARGLTP
ncbi:transcriptional regulator, TetR family [Alteribacillus bidgolensis]|uniref:Transcriptional regulator, TetR family n=1 Tax=Alteribacillus bidgolensis TaxID=930129 RepID=A0A1G8RJ90_9BACI|nr:TetR/AcrR family transcriptional regulator [Alteribacillus bidgolensis]SDJ17011.1 transcriptional regulator, TetR family [Alteribacillus bidgolensis]